MNTSTKSRNITKSLGCLFLVVGPSGAGKDSLLSAAKTALEDDPNFHFPRRLINRPNSGKGEDHIATSEADILGRIDAGEIGLHWQAHNLIYAIPADDLKPLEDGVHVVVNVSRTIIEQARARHAHIKVLSVTVDRNSLAKRLAKRGREDAAMVRTRLDRANAFTVEGNDVLEINNSGRFEQARQAFLAALQSETGAT